MVKNKKEDPFKDMLWFVFWVYFIHIGVGVAYCLIEPLLK